MGYECVPLIPEAFHLDEEGARLAGRISDGIERLPREKRPRVEAALMLAIDLHGDELPPRDDGTPVANHILRVGDNVINGFAVRDPDIIIAALLHDSVENQRGKLAAAWFAKHPENRHDPAVNERVAAMRWIAARFGRRVYRLIEALTKPDNPASKDPAVRLERERKYREQLEENLRNPSRFCVKLADFYDNVMAICHHVEEDDGNGHHHRLRARKYREVLDLFILPLRSNDPTAAAVPPETRGRIADDLEGARPYLEALAAKA